MYIRLYTLNIFTRLCTDFVLQGGSVATIQFLILAASHFLLSWMCETTGKKERKICTKLVPVL